MGGWGWHIENSDHLSLSLSRSIAISTFLFWLFLLPWAPTTAELPPDGKKAPRVEAFTAGRPVNLWWKVPTLPAPSYTKKCHLSPYSLTKCLTLSWRLALFVIKSPREKGISLGKVWELLNQWKIDRNNKETCPQTIDIESIDDSFTYFHLITNYCLFINNCRV